MANNISDWVVLDNDKALTKAVAKQNKWSRKTTSQVLDYQKDQLIAALKFVKEFDSAIDAGANYGIMSHHLHQRFNNVYAFELDSKVRACLEQNIAKFNLTSVKVFDCGLGDQEKNVSLKYVKNYFGTHIDPAINGGDEIIRTIDSFNFASCGFIKIDCEGYEPHIIRGAEQTIKKFKPVILMEDKNLSEIYGEAGQESVNILASWGYKKSVAYRKDCIMTYE